MMQAAALSLPALLAYLRPPITPRCAGPVACDFSSQRAALEKAFFTAADDTVATQEDHSAGVLRDLPLWRVQWTCLPGHNQLLHVHVPHYCHMFESMVRESGNRAEFGDRVMFGANGPLYGHLLLPGGSNSLGTPNSMLANGSPAPTVGTVLRLREVRRLGDGRLAIKSEAVCRFRVLRGTQVSPYSRADVAILPDAEEVLEMLAHEPYAALQSDANAKIAAATAGAAAATLVHMRYEAAGPSAPTLQEDIEENEPKQLCDLNLSGMDLDGCWAEAAKAAQTAARFGGSVEGMQAFESADEIVAYPGAARWLDSDWGPWRTSMVPPDADPSRLDLLGRAEYEAVSNGLAHLERAVWSELITCMHLIGRVRVLSGKTVGIDAVATRDAPVNLPETVTYCIPPEIANGVPAEWLNRWSPIRRAQRFSYMIASLLPDLDRQQLLQFSSAYERLDFVRQHLSERREHLAAMVALKGFDV